MRKLIWAASGLLLGLICAGLIAEVQATRNAAGTYALPTPGVPFQSSQVISSTQVNNTFNDIASTLTDSADRNGKGGFLASVRGIDGTVAAPAFSYTSETGSGYFRNAAGDVRMSILGALVGQWTANGLRVANGVVATPSLSFVNETGTGWYRNAAGDIRFAVSGADKQFLSATGLGIGVAPTYPLDIGIAAASGWTTARFRNTTSGSAVFVVSQGTTTGDKGFGFNLLFDGTNWKYDQTAAGSALTDSGGALVFLTTPSGTAGNTATLTERFRVNPSGVTIGATGTAISASYRGTASWTPGSVGATTCVTTTITVTGASAGADCMVTGPSVTDFMILRCLITANTCTVGLCNDTAGAFTGQSGTYACRVFNP